MPIRTQQLLTIQPQKGGTALALKVSLSPHSESGHVPNVQSAPRERVRERERERGREEEKKMCALRNRVGAR